MQRLYPEWKELYVHAREWDYGSEHSHDEISQILRLPKNTTKYYHAVAQCNRLLHEKDQKHLQVVTGVGYKVLKPEEHLTVATKILGQATKKIRKSYEIAYATPVHLLDAEHRVRWESFVERGMRLRALFEAERQEMRKVSDGKSKLLVVANERLRLF